MTRDTDNAGAEARDRDSELSPHSPATPEAERASMLRIYMSWHQDILQATRKSAVSPAFLAALTANESGGNPAAQVFEPGVYKHLQAVIGGEAPVFGSGPATDLMKAAQNQFEPQIDESLLPMIQNTQLALEASEAARDKLLREMATSWGLTQIMGYQAVMRKRTVQDLLSPAMHYPFAIELLEELGRRFQLSLSRDFDPLFRCWNSGHPNGKTFDPDYVFRGIQRMRIYSDLVEARSNLPAPPPQAGESSPLSGVSEGRGRERL